MKNVLVTGGEGFIGSHLCERLINAGFDVTVLGKSASVNKKKRIVDLLNINPEEDLTKGFDIIVHLAGVLAIDKTKNYPKETIINNVHSALNLLEDMRINNPNGLFIFASSDKVYGNPKTENVTENDNGIPLDPYGCSKSISELLIQTYHNLYGINYVIIRSGNVFGPNQSPELFIPYVLSQIANGETTIKIGNLENTRNFIYVSDLVDAYILCINNQNARNNVFNITSYKQRISDITAEISKCVKEITGQNVSFLQEKERMRSASMESRPFIMDCTKASQILGWKPKTSFSDAIEKTVSSYLGKCDIQTEVNI